jgi:hypothetical protein
MQTGDSGGPVFLVNSAYGIMSCILSDGYQLVYVAVDFVESGIGVTVLTN